MTTRPKFKAREMILLFLPMTLLGGVGWYFTRYPAESKYGSWRVVVDEVEIVPVTPREVAEGYDTKVVLRPRTTGTPQNLPGYRLPLTQLDVDSVRLASTLKSKERIIRRADQHNLRYTVINDSEVNVLMKLSRVPQSHREIKLKLELHNSALYIPNGPVNIPSGGIVEKHSSRVPVSIVVRRAGEKVITPALYKYRPFTVKSASIDKEMTSASDVLVQIVLKYEEEQLGKTPRFRNEVYVQDEKGRKYRTFKNAGSMYQLGVGHGLNNGSDKSIHNLYVNVPVSQIPKNAGKLIMKASICINDCWPLPISVVVREKNGTIPKPKTDTSKAKAEIPPIPASVP